MKKIMTSIVFVIFSVSVNATIINNGSFESGDFSGWTTQALPGPFFPLHVGGANESNGPFGLFRSAPTDGEFAALHAFDGPVGTIRIGQDITVTDQSIIEFDYRAGWNLAAFCGSCSQSRLFNVNVDSVLDGINLASFSVLTADARTVNQDTGNLLGRVDLSDFVGQTIHLSFDAIIPEAFTGPGLFQLDNVRSVSVPEPASIALILIGLAGLSRRRQMYKAKHIN